jgi:predicted nucleic acid-binding protein
MKRAVLDSSCAIALIEAGLLPKLALLFSEVLIPSTVRKELHRRTGRKPVLRRLHAGGFLRYCLEYDRVSAEILLPADRRRILKDLGEAEAIVQASTIGAAILADDLWARNIAGLQGLQCVGSLGVIRSLVDIGVLDEPSARSALHQIRSSGCFLPLNLVNEFLLSIGEDVLQQ